LHFNKVGPTEDDLGKLEKITYKPDRFGASCETKGRAKTQANVSARVEESALRLPCKSTRKPSA